MEFIVDSRKNWQPVQSKKTLFFLKPDDEINIYYLHGDWVYTPSYGRFTVDGDSNREAPAHYPLPNGNIGALVGRWVDKNSDPISDPIIKEPIFLVGKNFNYKNISKKILYLDLVINDDLTGEYGMALKDNDGTVTVEIQIGNLPYFYKEERKKFISELYDSAFSRMPDNKEWKWTENEKSASKEFEKLRASITGEAKESDDQGEKTKSQDKYYDHPWEAEYFNGFINKEDKKNNIRVVDKIRETDLFQFLQGLPKGAVLHLHPGAMGDFKNLVRIASEFEGDKCQVRFLYEDDPKKNPRSEIIPTNKDPDSFQWKSKPKENPYTDPEYMLGDYMDLSTALRDYQQAVYDLLILSPSVMNYAGDMWDLFQPVFSRVNVLLEKPKLETEYYNNAFKYLAETEHLSHVEIRTTWSSDEGKWEKMIQTAANSAGVSLKVIHSRSRALSIDIKKDKSKTTDEILAENRKFILDAIVETGKAIQGKKSQFLCGFDLFSEEDKGATTAYLTNDFHTAFHMLDNYLPPLFFHDGETNLPPSYNPNESENLAIPDTAYFNNNLVDLLLFHIKFTTQEFNVEHREYRNKVPEIPTRVGHGLQLHKSLYLLEKFKEAKIAVELCPISNQLLRYVKDIREHPGQAYLAAGLPVSINSDNPAIYGYQGISFDFWEVVIAWRLDLKMVKLLCFNSLKYSALSDTDKAAKISDWNQKWDAYITNFIN